MKLVFQRLLWGAVILLGNYAASSQNLTGIWRGYFITETGEQYRLEFQVEQSATRAVKGVSYSYLDKRFYGKATMTGNYAISNKSFQIQELRTTEVRNLGGGGTCLMNYKFFYTKSGREEFLEGTYVGKTEDRQNPKNNGVWGDCGGGKVYLRRVENSDFYVEPFLREKPVAKKVPATKKTSTKSTVKATPPVKKPATTQKTTKPANKTTIAKKPSAPVKKEMPVTKSRTNELPKTNTTTEQPKNKTIVARPITLPKQTRSRANELVKTLVVTNDEVIVKLYDNGEIDDDTISIFMDEKLILSQKRLSTQPITVTLKMDEENTEHVLVMVAENLGRIPPNTSLMIVHDGDKRYEVRITSTEQKNAMVRFRYQRSTP